MTNNEAILVIQERIEMMVNTEEIQKILIDMRLNGHSEEECKTWLTNAAIATLKGIK